MTADERRSARLLFSEELASGALAEAALDRPEVARAVQARRVPSRPGRIAQQVAMRRGRLTFEGASVAPMAAARRAVLGDDAAGPPRFLVRVDEFPHYRAWDEPARYGTDAFATFHAILRDAGVPYLVAVTPRVPREPLDPARHDWRPHDEVERAMLAQLRADGVAFAVHGLDHRTVHPHPRRHAELTGRPPAETAERLDLALETLHDEGLTAQVFVAPFNRFEAAQWPLLAERFAVVGGGPESVGLLGFHAAPVWRAGAVYLPAYTPLYGRAREVAGAVDQLVERRVALWLPIVLHWGWEADEGWEALRRLAARLGGDQARPWDEFLGAVAASGDDGGR